MVSLQTSVFDLLNPSSSLFCLLNLLLPTNFPVINHFLSFLKLYMNSLVNYTFFSWFVYADVCFCSMLSQRSILVHSNV